MLWTEFMAYQEWPFWVWKSMVASRDTIRHFSGDFFCPSVRRLSAIWFVAWQMSGSCNRKQEASQL